MTQDQTDAAAAQAALAKALPQISAALDLIGSDDSGASSPAGAPHDTAAKDNLAASYYGFTQAKVLVDAIVGDLNPVVVPPPVTPPPTTGKPLWGEYHAGDYVQSPSIVLDYADNSASTYTFTAARTAYLKGKRLMLKVGALTSAQATAIAETLVANGQPNAIIPIMWEGNQGVNGWETTWNENADTAAQFVALFNSICASMRAVPGADFTFAWCPNVAQQGNQKTGRTQFDTFPGTGVNGDIVIAPDGYDNPDDTGSQVAGNMAQTVLFEQFATSKGAKFAGLCECGDNASDDPTYWVGSNGVLTHAAANGWEFVTNFQATTQEGGSFDSTTGPNSKATIVAFYA